METKVDTQGFFPDEHKFFDALVTMLMSLSSYLFTAQTALLSSSPKEWSKRSLQEWMNYIRPLKDPNHFLSFDVVSSNQNMVFWPFDLINHISLNSWPQFIEYNLMQQLPGTSGFQIDSTGHRKIVSRIVGGSFISYYQLQLTTIETKYEKDTKLWPATLRFARHIRNGFAHNGAFDIQGTPPPVTWKKWLIDHSFHGKPLLFEPYSLGIGDLILLMDEVNTMLK